MVALVAVLVIAIAGFMYPKGTTQVKEIIEKQLGSIVGPEIFDALRFGGGVTYGSTLSTSTAASMTLRKADLIGYDTVIVSPTGAAAAKTFTFFASSTAPDWLPIAGDTQKTCFLNATGTAATTLVFAAGTGIDLQVATSTGSAGGAFDKTISANATGCFTFIRKAATASTFDIEANLVEFGN